MTPIAGYKLLQRLVKIFDLPNNVSRVVIDIKINDIVRIYVEHVADKDEVDVALDAIAKHVNEHPTGTVSEPPKILKEMP